MKKIITIGPDINSQGGIASVEKLIINHLPDKMTKHMISTYKEGGYLKKIFIFVLAVLKLFRLIIFERIDLVHIHFASYGSALRKFIISLILITFRKPFILHAHGAELHLFINSLPRLLFRLVQFVLNKSEYLIVLSESWKMYFYENIIDDKDKIKVLPNPIVLPDNEYLNNKKDQEKIRLLFLGRICKRKGVYDIINAIKLLPDDVKNKILLEMAGDGEVNKVKKIINDLNLSEQIIVYSWLSEDEKKEKLDSADIFILPSYNEGLPMALLEAMSYRLAPITTPVGGIPEIIEDGQNGILVKPGDINMIAKAIEQLIYNREFLRFLGINARLKVEEFDINSYINKLLNIYGISDEIRKNKSISF